MQKIVLTLISLWLCTLCAFAQTFDDQQTRQYEEGRIFGNKNEEDYQRTTWGRDTTGGDDEEPIPIGLYQWRIDSRLGTVIPAENNDTVVQNFQNFNYTDGYTGQYNYLANLGSPRLNRFFFNREEDDNFLFLTPLSYFRTGLQDFRFTNTKSPITNLAYHSAGDSHNGEDRVRVYFASNIKKTAGIGLKFDYLYGRGFYNSSANSQLGGTLYGYFLGERYNMHAYLNINSMKRAENGGIEDDKYITDPQSFAQSYTSENIPVNLSETWNRDFEQNYYLTHKYHLGYYRDLEVPDSLKPKMPSADELMDVLSDSLIAILMTDSLQRATVVDSLKRDWEAQQIPPQEFIPVASILHTFDANVLNHEHLSRKTPPEYYTHHYYGNLNDVDDNTQGLSIRNTLGLTLNEGFRKWVQMGMTAFATHRLRNYNLPNLQDTTLTRQRWSENDLSVGVELAREKGRFIHYRATGELFLIGEKAGDFDVRGNVDLDIPLGKWDSLLVNIKGRVGNELPGFYYRHYHAQSAWWDNALNREFRGKIDGTISLKRVGTRVRIGFENINNYTYFGMDNTLKEGKSPESVVPADYTHAVRPYQHNGSVQVFSASLAHDLALGPFHWDNEVIYQASSNQDILPLPALTLYSNLYFVFRIAKVLRVQAGGDLRFFTSYYAPDYAPNIGMFATQDTKTQRIKIGNYPIINAYINLHLKQCRIYVALSHVNAGNGRYFLAPHYPINPLAFRFGISWNFFN